MAGGGADTHTQLYMPESHVNDSTLKLCLGEPFEVQMTLLQQTCCDLLPSLPLQISLTTLMLLKIFVCRW